MSDLPTTHWTEATIDATGDVCQGDVILFRETVWSGAQYGKRKPAGERSILALVERDSYGAAKQQHTFTLVVLWSHGVQPLERGTRTRRKGRNVYRNGTMRAPWADEAARQEALDEKHRRGEAARAERERRRMGDFV